MQTSLLSTRAVQLGALLLAADMHVAASASYIAWEGCNIPIPSDATGVFINVEMRVFGTVAAAVPGWDLNPSGADGLVWSIQAGGGMMRLPGTTSGSAGNLIDSTGWSVGPGSTFGSGGVVFGSGAGQWHLDMMNVFGFRFRGGDGQTRYGFGTLSMGSAPGGSGRVITNIFIAVSPNSAVTHCLTPHAYNRDLDGDGFGNPSSGAVWSCWGPPGAGWVWSGWGVEPVDCDDADPRVHPLTVWYRDEDGDGHGHAPHGTRTQCEAPPGHALLAGDNCPDTPNPGQDDCDENGVGDACEPGGTRDCNVNGIADFCDIAAGAPDKDLDGRIDACERAVGDLDLDGEVGASDLAELLQRWGEPGGSVGDLDGSGLVDAGDLSRLLASWGPVGE